MTRSASKKRVAALKRALVAQAGNTPFSVFSTPAVVGNGKNKAKRARKRRAKAAASFGMTLGSKPSGNQSAAAAYAQGQRSSEPMIQASARSCRIIHRELVGTVVGTADFTVGHSIALNPGISASFPWLATQAQGWQQYIFRRLKFCYYTRTGSTTPGSVMLVPDYNAADSAPTTEQTASAYRDVIEEVPWTVAFSCVLDARAMMEPSDRKFVRTGSLASNLDIKTYDGGNFYVCTTDGTAVNWGKLWVEYDVEFFVPQLPPSGSFSVSSQHVQSAAPTTSSLFASPSTIAGSDTIVTISSNVLTFVLPGTYVVVASVAASTSVTQTATMAVGSGCSFVTTYGTNDSNPGQNGSATGTTFSTNALVSTDVGGTVTFDLTLVGGTYSELFIAKVSDAQT